MALGKVIGRVAIKVLPDTSDFREDTANDLRRIEKQLGNLEVDVIPELDKAAKAKLKAELKAWAEGLNVSVKVDLDLNNRDLVQTAIELEELTKRRKVAVAPELDNGAVAKVATGLAAISGLRYTVGLFRRFREELLNIDKAVPKIGVVAHAIAGLGAYVLGVSGNLFSLSNSLAQIGKVGLVLPGIFAGIAIGLGTTAAALKDFNEQVPQASGYLSALQDTISQNFWEQAAVPIRNLVDNLFPLLNKALAGTSTALGGFFANLAGSMQDILLPSLPGMFDSLTESIKIASGFTDAFVGIIEKLGTLGASYLPRLAQFVGDISTQFDNFLGESPLTLWVEQGIQAAKDLGSVIASTTSIIRSIGIASEAAGGATLGSMADGLRDIAEAAKSPGFQSGLTATLTAVYDMLNQISSIAGPAVKDLIVVMAERFQSLGPTIGDTIGTAFDAIARALSNPAVGAGLEAMFEGFNNMVHSLAPLADLFGEKLGAMMKVVGSLATNIGLVMAALGETLKPIFVNLVDAALPLIDAIGPMMADAIAQVAPLFEVLGSNLGNVIGAIKPLVETFFDLFNVLAPILVPILKVVASILGDALVGVITGVTMVFQGLVGIIEGVVSVFTGLWDVIKGIFTLDFGLIGEGLGSIFSGLKGILMGGLKAAFGAVWAYLNGTVLGFFRGIGMKLLGPLAGPFSKIFDPIMKAGSKIVGWIKGFISKVIGFFQGGGGGGGIAAAISGPFQSVIGVVRSVFSIIWTVIKTAWTVITTIFGTAIKIIWTVVKTGFGVVKTVISTYFSIFKTIISTAWNVIKVIFSTALNIIKTVFTTVWGAIKGFLQTTMDALYFVFKGPWDAISELFFGVLNTIRATFLLVWNAIKSFLFNTMLRMQARMELAWDAIKGATKAVWNFIKKIVMGSLKAVWNIVKKVIGTVKKVIKTAWNYIKRASKRTWNGIKKVIKSAWDKIKGFVTGAINKVKSKISGAWNFIKTNTSAAWNRLKSIIRYAWTTIKGLVLNAVNKVKSRISGAWNTIKSKTSSAFNKVKSTVKEAWNKVKTAVVEGVRTAIDKVKQLPSKAKNALLGIGTVLANAGKDLIGGFIDGITSKFDDVKGALGGLTGKLTSWKGPPKKDAVLLKDAGRLIIDGLIHGFEDRFAAVRSMLTSLTNDIAGFVGRSMSKQISDALSFAINGKVATTIQADTHVQGVDLDRRLSGLERRVTSSARNNISSAQQPADQSTSVKIDNIAIPLEDLAQLKDLEEFLDLLRVRIRQEV